MVSIPYALEDVQAEATASQSVSEGEDDCAGNGWQDFPSLGFTDEAGCREYFADLAENRITDYVDD